MDIGNFLKVIHRQKGDNAVKKRYQRRVISCGKIEVSEGEEDMSRVRQFIKDFFAPFYALDEFFISQYLTEEEMHYFQKLRRAERLHAIEVAKLTEATLKAIPEKKITEKRIHSIMKAVLLHDIGKSRHALGPFRKTFMVLFKGTLKKPGSILAKTKAGDIYLNHPAYGRDLLEALDTFPEDPYLYDLVLWHHEPEKFLEKYKGLQETVFRAFRKADDLN